MANRIPSRVLRQIQKARSIATMETASFGMPHEKVIFNGREIPVTEFIREQTRLWRETWIIPELDSVIAWAERKAD